MLSVAPLLLAVAAQVAAPAASTPTAAANPPWLTATMGIVGVVVGVFLSWFRVKQDPSKANKLDALSTTINAIPKAFLAVKTANPNLANAAMIEQVLSALATTASVNLDAMSAAERARVRAAIEDHAMLVTAIESPPNAATAAAVAALAPPQRTNPFTATAPKKG